LHGPGLGVRLGIVHRDLHYQVSIIQPAEPLRYFRGVRRRAAETVQPQSVPEAIRLHHQRVLVPLACRVPAPGRLRVQLERPAVGEDLTISRVALVENDYQTW